jgi:hypothetical protein
VEGGTSVRPGTNPLRIQYLVPASDFAGLPDSHRTIVSFNFRSDNNQTEAVDWTIPHERLWMSTTNKESLTSVFDDNHGSDKTLVFDGTFTYPLLGTGPPEGPRDFADGTRLQTPFYYDPSKGNLLIEAMDIDKGLISTIVDLFTTPGEARTLLSAGNATAANGDLLDVAVVIQVEFVPEPFPVGVSPLRAGDADRDLDFDQLDLVRVQIAAKYLTGQSATWGEGDWDGAPGGTQHEPPAGDRMFNQLDIIVALNAGTYLNGPYAAIRGGGQRGDAQTSVGYDANTGELFVDVPAGTQLSSINIDSADGVFTGDAAQNLGGSFDNDADGNIFKATFGSSFGSLSFGNVAQSGLSESFLLNDLTVVGSLAGGGALGQVDLIYIPEPSALILSAMGLVALKFQGWRRHARARTRLPKAWTIRDGLHVATIRAKACFRKLRSHCIFINASARSAGRLLGVVGCFGAESFPPPRPLGCPARRGEFLGSFAL